MGKKRSDVVDLTLAPRIAPEVLEFTATTARELEGYGFRKDKQAYRAFPAEDLERARDVLKELHQKKRFKVTPTMSLPYYLAHHVFERSYTERECEYMIRKLAAIARAHLLSTEAWNRAVNDASSAAHVLLNEQDEEQQQFSDDDEECDPAAFFAACESWAKNLTNEEADAMLQLVSAEPNV
jgi:hypothetical protein